MLRRAKTQVRRPIAIDRAKRIFNNRAVCMGCMDARLSTRDAMSKSNSVLERAMNFSVVEGALATVMGTLLGGVFLTGFALELGASRLQIGIMAALPMLGHASQFAGAFILNRTGRSKQLCMLATWISRLMWLPILFVPFLLSHWSPDAQAWCVIGLLAVVSGFGSIGGLAWLDWIKRLVPEECRVQFLARRNLYNSGLSLAMSLAAAMVISWLSSEQSQTVSGFVTVFAMALVCGVVGVVMLGRIPASDSDELPCGTKRAPFTTPLKSQNYRRLLVGYSVWQFATQLAAPFFAVYMLQKLHLPFWAVMALATCGSLLALALNGFWTKLKLRFGVRPVVLIATLFDVMLPLAWVFVHPQSLWLVIPVHAFAMLNPPLAMGPQNLLLRIAPNRNSASYLALFNAATGAIGAVGAMVGGSFAMVMQGQWHFLNVELTGIQLLFAVSGIGKLAGFFCLSQVQEEGSASVPEVLRTLISERLLRPIAERAK